MNSREKHIQEIKNLQEAIKKTKSPYARRDFEKALQRKKKELREYDGWKRS